MRSRRGWRRPRRSPTPPARRSSQPRAAHASGHEYQPFSPPMASMMSQTTAGGASTWRLRTSWKRLPPAQWGSEGRGSLGASLTAADDQRVSTWAFRTRARARRTASSTPTRPSGGSGR